jgi:Calcineurin-like phosphoesterase
MADLPDNIRNKIVTLNSLALPAAPGAAFESTTRSDDDPAILRRERFEQIRERLRQEAEEVGDGLMITVPDREVSLAQSAIARDGQAVRSLGGGGFEVKFGTGLGGGDIFGWMRSLFDWVDRGQAHPMLRPTSTKPNIFENKARIAMTADWGTGLYGAPRIATQMTQMGVFDLLLHLGDVYYSGTRGEIQERFLDVWPRAAGKVSRTLNSNHEMYSGGFGYFELALPALGQTSSYFAFENDHWLLVGLDTAYVDHDMDNQQVAWLNAVIRQAGGKKVVLFSHQQLFSRLDAQGPKLLKALRHLLEQRAISAWYWGHEHQCVIYDPHPQFGLLGRCLGNGGIPEARKQEVKVAPAESIVGSVSWKRMSATNDSPSCLALDGPNPDIPKQQDQFVPHGFMTLEFDGPKLTERVFLSDGQEVLTNQVA